MPINLCHLILLPTNLLLGVTYSSQTTYQPAHFRDLEWIWSTQRKPMQWQKECCKPHPEDSRSKNLSLSVFDSGLSPVIFPFITWPPIFCSNFQCSTSVIFSAETNLLPSSVYILPILPNQILNKYTSIISAQCILVQVLIYLLLRFLLISLCWCKLN